MMLIRICRKCRKIYESDLQFCTDDGTILYSRSFDERKFDHFFGTANFAGIVQPTMVMPFQSVRYRWPESAKSKWPLHFGLAVLLTIILLIGGGFAGSAYKLVAANRAAEIASMPDTSPDNLSEQNEREVSNAEQTENEIGADEMNAIVDSNKPEMTKPSKTPPPVKFNGRVIMLNAILRTAPTMEADELAILPAGEPLKIGKRASANSPWYQVVTAQGSKGWMHGNTIEFN